MTSKHENKGKGDLLNCLSISIISILVLVDVVAQMQDIVHGVLSRRITERVEIAKWVVATGVDRKRDLCDRVSGSGCRLGSANYRRLRGVANRKLVVVVGKRLKVSGLDLDGIVHVRSCVGLSLADDLLHVLVGSNLVVETHWGVGDGQMLISVAVDWDWVV